MQFSRRFVLRIRDVPVLGSMVKRGVVLRHVRCVSNRRACFAALAARIARQAGPRAPKRILFFLNHDRVFDVIALVHFTMYL